MDGARSGNFHFSSPPNNPAPQVSCFSPLSTGRLSKLPRGTQPEGAELGLERGCLAPEPEVSLWMRKTDRRIDTWKDSISTAELQGRSWHGPVLLLENNENNS